MTMTIIPPLYQPEHHPAQRFLLETETWFDQRPTHFFRPAWVVDAQENANQAWAERDLIIDAGLESGETDQAALQEATQRAEDADDRYHELYRLWQLGYEPAELPGVVSIDVTVEQPL